MRDLGVDASPDTAVASMARNARRVLVTENVKNFAAERDLAIVCVLTSRLRRRDMSAHLIQILDGWAQATPEPYLGLRWRR